MSARTDPRFAEVDVLKAIGIIAVVFIHSIRGGFDPSASRFEVVIGLAMRFAVPGFLLASGFLYATERPVPAAMTVRRLRRIVAPYLLVSLAAQAWVAWRGETTPGGSVAVDLLFGSSFGPYYYVFVIVGLVLATPVFALLPRRLFPWLTLGFVAAHWSVETSTPEWIPFYWHLRSPLMWWSYFLLGWTARLHYDALAPWIRERRGGIAVTLTAVAAAALVTATAFPSKEVDHQAAWVSSYALLGLLFSVSCGRRDVPAWLRFLSGATYGIYLLHLFFVYAVADHFPPPRGQTDLLAIGLPWAAGLLGASGLIAAARATFGRRSRLLVGA